MRNFLLAGFTVILGAMLVATVRASLDESVFTAGGELWRDPWGRATILDAYFGFLVVLLWIGHRERTVVARLGWTVGVLALGNIAIAVYFIQALLRLPPQASWTALFERLPARRAGGPRGGGR